MKLPKQYPVWFPYPSSWLRSLALILIGLPLSQVILFGYFILVSAVFIGYLEKSKDFIKTEWEWAKRL